MGLIHAIIGTMPKLKANPPRIGKAVDRVQSGDSWRADKQTSAQRGYGHKWRVARAHHLSENPLCVCCRALGIVEAATVVDHIVDHMGNQQLFWDSANWQALCKPCHDKKPKP